MPRIPRNYTYITNFFFSFSLLAVALIVLYITRLSVITLTLEVKHIKTNDLEMAAHTAKNEEVDSLHVPIIIFIG